MTVTRTTRTTGPSTSLTGTGSASRRAPDDPNQNLGNNPPNQGGAPGGGGGGAPGGGGGDGGGPPDGGPAPQVPPQDANQPPIFGLTPGTAGYQIIDYNSKAGYSKFKAGTSALNEELYDCSPDGFYQFTRQLDYVLAFPQAPVERTIYMNIPKGFQIEDGNTKDYVLKLHRNVYGQKQAGRVWYKYLTNKLINEVGFKQSEVDECVFYRGNVMYVLYTDDSILAGPDLNENEQSRAGSDNAIIRHDLQVRPRMAMTPRGYPRWDGHAANTLLKLDFDAIEEGLTEEMAPIQWQQSRDEYKEFPLQVFRDHIHQEKRSRRARPYWMYQTKKN